MVKHRYRHTRHNTSIMAKDMKQILSLIMINNNRSAYIREAIDSVVRQSDERWELIILDDGSTDYSRQIIEEYKDYANIKVIYHDKRQGIAKSRIEAVSLASGDIIGLIDSDDKLDKEAVNTMLKAHIENENGLIYSQMVICDQYLQPKNKNANRQIKNNLIDNAISHFITFKKKTYEKIGGYDKLFNKCAEDKDLFYRMEEATDPLFIDKILYYYRMNPTSSSSYGYKRFRGRVLYLLAKYRAFRRRKRNSSPKAIKFSEIFHKKQ